MEGCSSYMPSPPAPSAVYGILGTAIAGAVVPVLLRTHIHPLHHVTHPRLPILAPIISEWIPIRSPGSQACLESPSPGRAQPVPQQPPPAKECKPPTKRQEREQCRASHQDRDMLASAPRITPSSAPVSHSVTSPAPHAPNLATKEQPMSSPNQFLFRIFSLHSPFDSW